MGKFFDGFVAGAILIFVGIFLFLYFGFIDPRADMPNNTVSTWVAAPSLDAAVRRLAPPVWDPVQPDEPNLVAGMKLYQAHCSTCHGDVAHRESAFAEALKPHPKQFVQDREDLPENEDFYIILHGIRWSGMPSWNHKLAEKQIWQVITFLTAMPKLPPSVTEQWKAAAAASRPLF